MLIIDAFTTTQGTAYPVYGLLDFVYIYSSIKFIANGHDVQVQCAIGSEALSFGPKCLRTTFNRSVLIYAVIIDEGEGNGILELQRIGQQAHLRGHLKDGTYTVPVFIERVHFIDRRMANVHLGREFLQNVVHRSFPRLLLMILLRTLLLAVAGGSFAEEEIQFS